MESTLLLFCTIRLTQLDDHWSNRSSVPFPLAGWSVSFFHFHFHFLLLLLFFFFTPNHQKLASLADDLYRVSHFTNLLLFLWPSRTIGLSNLCLNTMVFLPAAAGITSITLASTADHARSDSSSFTIPLSMPGSFILYYSYSRTFYY